MNTLNTPCVAAHPEALHRDPAHSCLPLATPDDSRGHAPTVRVF